MRSSLQVSMIAASLAAACQAVAADQVTIADPVVVSASRSTQKLLDADSSISTVSGSKVAGDTTQGIADALRDVPGIRVIDDGTPGFRRLSIRGEEPGRTLFAVNGDRVADQKTMSGAPLLVNPYFVDRIEVVRGPASLLYGSDAMGGMVNVITKQASKKPFAAETGVSYSGAYEGFTFYANASGTVGKFRYALGGFGTDLGDMYLKGHDRLGSTSSHSKGANADFKYDPTEDTTIGYAYEYVDSSAHTATTVSDEDYHDFTASIPEWKRIKHSLTGEVRNIGDWLGKLKLTVYHQGMDKEFIPSIPIHSSSPYAPRSPLVVDIANEQKTIGGTLQADMHFGDIIDLTAGYDVSYTTLDSDTASDITMTLPYVGLMTFNYAAKDRDYYSRSNALFALLHAHLTDSLTFSTGARWNRIETGGGYTRSNYQAYTPDSNPGSSTFTRTVGSASLVWQPTARSSFRASWSQGFRAPSIQELFLTTAELETQRGNSSLKPEKTNNYEIGFRYMGDVLTADAALFYSHADDYIASRAVGSGRSLYYTYQNISEAETYGLELSMSVKAGIAEPYASITLMNREFKTGGVVTTDTGTPKLHGRVGTRLSGEASGVALGADFFARFASKGIYDDSRMPGTSYVSDNDLPGYVTANMSFTAAFGSEQQYKLGLNFENLLDARYRTSELIEEPGRFVSVTASAAF
jgi:hemoglobin/transferrin/lactoferrin receptor protein